MRTSNAAVARVDRRTPRRRYEPLLPEFHPVKLAGSFVSVDFAVGCSLECAARGAHRHPARAALLDAGIALDARVPPRVVLGWLRSMPSYHAGVQLRLGHHTDAGLAFEKCAELIELLPAGRSVVYPTRRPFTGEERSFFSVRRANVLLELTATPRSASLGVADDPLALLRSAEGLDPGAHPLGARPARGRRAGRRRADRRRAAAR